MVDELGTNLDIICSIYGKIVLNKFWVLLLMKTKMMIAVLLTVSIAIPPAVYAEANTSGTFVDGDWLHKTQGTVKVIPTDSGSVLRLESFKTTNGPDLYVYLATDDKASNFVNLGTLKGSSGNQNYEIPVEVDLSKYNKVLIWCKAFSVLFGTAELS